MHVLQANLDRMKNEWNRHRIRANKIHVNGIPDYLFYLPQYRGNNQFGAMTCQLCLQFLQDFTTIPVLAVMPTWLLCQQYASEKPASNIPEFIELAELIMEEEDIQAPTDAMEALSLYLTLVNLITQIH